METIDKEALIKESGELKLKHEAVKAKMIELLDAIRILDEEYKELEKNLYSIEEQYVMTMDKLIG